MEKKNFIVITKKDDEGNKIIDMVIAYDEELYKKVQKNYNKQDYFFSDFADYRLGERVDFYKDGKRLTDYEIYLKYDINMLPPGLKYNDQGETILMTDDEKMIAGEIEVKEGYEIVNKKLVPIPYWNLKKEYKENKDNFYESLKRHISEKKDNKLKETLIILEGHKFQNNLDKESLQNLIEYDIPIEWRDVNNELVPLSKDKGILLIKKSEELKQETLKEYWIKTEELKKMIDDDADFQKIIDFVESYCNKSIDNAYANEEKEHVINEDDLYKIPQESPYSGLLEEEEIKSLKERKGIRTKKKN